MKLVVRKDGKVWRIYDKEKKEFPALIGLHSFKTKEEAEEFLNTNFTNKEEEIEKYLSIFAV